MDSAEFHERVYTAVREIPHGKVTSYGHIAKMIGMPRHSRHVGQALKFLPDGTDIPWHRVIASNGTISVRGGGEHRQRDCLVEEDVEVSAPGAGNGLMRVKLGEYGWFPEPTPIEEDTDDT